MLHINIIAASQIKKSSYIGKLINTYIPRFNLIKPTIQDFNDKNMSKDKINNKLLSLISTDSTPILLDEKGQRFSTFELTNFLQKLADVNNKLSFLIAGAEGFNEKSKQSIKIHISLSQLTFPHQIARLVLIEQLYRIQSIIQNHPYHKI